MKKTYNTYQSITLWHYANDTCHMAHIYTSVKSAQLDLHTWVSYDAGKSEMAKLMYRLGKMPRADHYGTDGNRFTVYSLDGYLE